MTAIQLAELQASLTILSPKKGDIVVVQVPEDYEHESLGSMRRLLSEMRTATGGEYFFLLARGQIDLHVASDRELAAIGLCRIDKPLVV